MRFRVSGFRCQVLALIAAFASSVWSDGGSPSRDGEPPSLHAGTWKRLPDLPDKLGVAGAFAGVVVCRSQEKIPDREILVCAGGANFPDAPPWEGGKKIFYDSIWALENPDGEWREAGRLPAPLAYGVSARIGGETFWIAGGNATANFRDAWRIYATNNLVEFEKLPALPIPAANACGAAFMHHFVVAGGEAMPGTTSALTNVWWSSKSDDPWNAAESWPGPARTLAIGGAVGGTSYLMGGVELSAGPDGKPQRKYLRDAYALHWIQWKWRRIADLPFPLAASPSPAATVNGKLIIFGGDDAPSSDPKTHKGFRDEMLEYDPATDKWTIIGHMPAPRATAPVVFWNSGYVIVSGEVRRGVRSREVWMWTP